MPLEEKPSRQGTAVFDIPTARTAAKKQQSTSEPAPPVVDTVLEKTDLMKFICKSEKKPLVNDDGDDSDDSDDSDEYDFGSTNIMSKSRIKFRMKTPVVVSCGKCPSDSFSIFKISY